MAQFVLRASSPYRLDLTVWVLRRLPINQMDRWDGQTYRRVLVVGERPVEIEVTQTAAGNRPQLLVTTRGGRVAAKTRERITTALTRMLGLNVDLSPFYEMAGSDRLLSGLVTPFVGFRPPRLASPFEALINGVACQQLSLIVGITLLNRLSAAFGPAVGEAHTFPQPEALAACEPARLRKLGFSGRKGDTIVTLARAVSTGQLDLEALSELSDAEAVRQLRQLPGVGRWTAEYVLLRGLGRIDVFPADDVGSQNKFQNWLNLQERPDYDAVQRILRRWRPYRGLLYFFLLLNHMAQMGILERPPAATPLHSGSARGKRIQ